MEIIVAKDQERTDDVVNDEATASEGQVDSAGQQELDLGVDDSVEDGGQSDDAGDDSGAGGEEAESSQPTALDRLREIGIEAESPDQALEQVADRFEQTRDYIERMREEFKELREQNRTLLGMAAQRPQEQPAAQPNRATGDPESSPWRKVQPLGISDQVLRMYRNEDGTWKDGTPQEVIQEAVRYQGDVQRTFETLMQDPEGFLSPGIESVVRKVISEEMGQFEKKQGTRTRLQQIESEIRPHLYAIDPTTGQEDTTSLSDFGNVFYDVLKEVEQDIRDEGGEPSKELVFQRAYKIVRRLIPRQNGVPVPEKPAGQPNEDNRQWSQREQRRREHTRKSRAAGVQQAGGTLPASGGGSPRKQNRLLGIDVEFAKQLEQEGFFSNS